MKIIAPNLQTTWTWYKSFVANSFKIEPIAARNTLKSWQNKLFASITIYLIPFSIIALIPCLVIEADTGHYVVACFDIFTIAMVTVLLLSRNILLKNKRLILIVAAVIFSMASSLVFGYYLVGAIYLFGVSIFVAYQYSRKHAYFSIVANLLIFNTMAACIYYKVSWIPFTITMGPFMLFISNLMFLNVITVVIIRQTLVNLDRSILKEALLFGRLQNKLNEVAQLNTKLAESEAFYKTLFFLSPLPKWIYDIESNEIRQANEAAIHVYGYTQDELLSMSKIQQDTHQTSASQKLIKKNGDVCYVDIRWTSVLYQGKPSRLVTVVDTTEKVNHLHEIKHQNQKLQEIAFMQAHVIRSPLTNIMALSELIITEYQELQTEPIFTNLKKSTAQLDEVVREIIRHSEEILGK